MTKLDELVVFLETQSPEAGRTSLYQLTHDLMNPIRAITSFSGMSPTRLS